VKFNKKTNKQKSRQTIEISNFPGFYLKNTYNPFFFLLLFVNHCFNIKLLKSFLNSLCADQNLGGFLVNRISIHDRT
jgi:hypothetical protein